MQQIEINWGNKDLLYEGCSIKFDSDNDAFTIRNIRATDMTILADCFKENTWELVSQGMGIVFSGNYTGQSLMVKDPEVIDYDGDDDDCI